MRNLFLQSYCNIKHLIFVPLILHQSAAGAEEAINLDLVIE